MGEMIELTQFSPSSSGEYGDEGKMLMIAMGYTIAGAMIVLIFSIIGCCVFGKGAGAYDEDMIEEEVANGVHADAKKKYSKVDIATDA
jgi:hypothetical protein